MRLGQIVLPAYRFLLSELGVLSRLAAPILALILFGAAWVEMERSIPAAFVSSAVALLLLTQFACVVFSGLLAGRPPSLIELAKPHPRCLPLLGHFIAAGALALSPLIVAITVTGVSAANEWFWSAFASVMLWPFSFATAIFVAVRLALVPPLAVAPQPGGGAFVTSWRLTRRRFGLVFGVLLFTVAPFLLVDTAFRIFLLATADPSMGVALFGGAISGIINLTMIVVSAYAMVELTRAFTAAAGAAPRSAPGGPSA